MSYTFAPQNSEESVYNLLDQQTQTKSKEKRHRSKFDPTAPPTASTFGLLNTSTPGIANISGVTEYDPRNSEYSGHKVKRSTGAIGKPVREEISPSRFLTRGSGLGGTSGRLDMTLQNTNKSFTGRDTSTFKEPVPKRTDRPIMGLTTNKNFISTNAREAILTVPKKVKSNPVRYIEKPDFGKVPEYLEKVKEEVKQEYDYIRELKSLQSEPQTNKRRGQEMTLLPEEDRLQILNSLKEKWDELNQKYQGLSFNVPASKGNQPMLDKTKVARKENLELQLDQLEKDIAKFSKPNIFIQE